MRIFKDKKYNFEPLLNDEQYAVLRDVAFGYLAVDGEAMIEQAVAAHPYALGIAIHWKGEVIRVPINALTQIQRLVQKAER